MLCWSYLSAKIPLALSQQHLVFSVTLKGKKFVLWMFQNLIWESTRISIWFFMVHNVLVLVFCCCSPLLYQFLFQMFSFYQNEENLNIRVFWYLWDPSIFCKLWWFPNCHYFIIGRMRWPITLWLELYMNTWKKQACEPLFSLIFKGFQDMSPKRRSGSVWVILFWV